MDFALSPQAEALRQRLSQFFEQEVLPRHGEWLAHVGRSHGRPGFMAELQDKARAAGLWNLGLPDLAADQPGTRCSNLDFAPLAEIMGRLPWGSEPFNCQAPDVPNMILLQNVATPAQKARWLRPLLEGRMRSAFAMTEPDVASSDATNIATSFERSANRWLINGRKWYITGAGHPDCRLLIVMGRLGESGQRTGRHAMLLVPVDWPGVRLVRPLRFLGWEDHVAPIAELEFRDVEVPLDFLLGAEGEGFAAAQVRLGPARIHHCMRLIGGCEAVLALMQQRAQSRSAFGRPLADYDSFQHGVALSRVEIEQARLLVLKAAWLIDRAGFRAAQREVSLAKVAVPAMAQRLADRAVQSFGAMGGSDDTPIHALLAYARLMRIADGPDEVHLRQIFRAEPAPAGKLDGSPFIARS